MLPPTNQHSTHISLPFRLQREFLLFETGVSSIRIVVFLLFSAALSLLEKILLLFFLKRVGSMMVFLQKLLVVVAIAIERVL